MPAIALPSVDLMVILQLVVLLGSATAILLIDLWIPANQKRITALLAFAATVAALVVGPMSTQGLTLSGTIGFGPSTLIINSIILIATAISILFANDSFAKQGITRGEAYVLILLATSGMLLLSQGSSLVTLFMGLELLSIALYVLTAIAYPQQSSEEAGFKYLTIGAFGAGFLVFGIALTFGATGSLLLNEIAARVPTEGVNLAYFSIGIMMLLVGFGYKVSLVPFHMWTPDVYQGAPTAVTAYMSVGSKVAGFVAIMAIIQMIGGLTDSLLPLLQGIAVLTMIVGSLIAIKQSSLKRMLAYSSIGHAGFIMLAILSSAYNTGARAPIFYLAAYTITNLAAFGVIMALEDNKDRDLTVADLAGLWQRNPWLTAVMTLALLSLAGAPPTAGFLAKFMVLASVWQAGWMWMAIAVAVASAISAYFYLRCVVQLFSNSNDTQAVTTSGLTRVGLLVVSAAIIVVGIMPWTLNSLAMAGN